MGILTVGFFGLIVLGVILGLINFAVSEQEHKRKRTTKVGRIKEGFNKSENLQRFRAARQRIIEKGYPLPGFLRGDVADDIKSAESAEMYEKRMDKERIDKAAASMGGQSKPMPTPCKVTFSRSDQKNGYTDMYTLRGGKSVLDWLTESLRDLQLEADFLKLDAAGIGYLQQLTAHDHRQWKGRLAQKEQFTDKMTGMFFEGIDQMNKWIDIGYEQMDKPGVNADPAYRQAFEKKVQEVRLFLAWVGEQR